jgi:2'-hydroxyisoflavone reductase
VRLLLLGGPKFLGRAIASAALERGHELTVFNRGRTNPELFPEAEKLVGDRNGDLRALHGRQWDAVIDTSGYVPRVVRAAAETLSDSGLYCFVSSISVYEDFSVPMDEESARAPLGEDPIDDLTPNFSNYGALKALCEDAVCEALGDRALVIRPGLIVGPHDPTGRFTYWPHRIARGGEVVAPAPGERKVQFIDVRDLGDWMIGLCERHVAGTFNATNTGLPWSELLESCRRVTGADADFAWLPEDFLLEHGVADWRSLPMWFGGDPAMASANHAIVDQALEAGLRFRPLDETVRGALEDAPTTETAGLTPERETELLAEWHGRG